MCTDLYYCDPEEFIEYQTVYHEYDHIKADEIMEAIGKLSLGFLGSMVLLQFGLLFYNIYKVMNVKTILKNRLTKLDTPKDKKVKIIRGVPGVGKRSYVYYLENELNREFVVIDVNDYFTKGDDYFFDGKKLAEAEADTMNCFMHALENNDKRIYVIGTFEKKWMYKNYIDLAKMCNYKVSVTELECVDTDELKHFNKRSKHDVPYNKSLKAFNSWEKDEDSYKRVPYLSDNLNLLNKRTPCLISDSEEDEQKENNDKDEFNELPNIKKLEDCPLVREIKYVDEESSDDESGDDESEDEGENESDTKSSSSSNTSEYETAYNDVTL